MTSSDIAGEVPNLRTDRIKIAKAVLLPSGGTGTGKRQSLLPDEIGLTTIVGLIAASCDAPCIA
jgi:hypothetical protein